MTEEINQASAAPQVITEPRESIKQQSVELQKQRTEEWRQQAAKSSPLYALAVNTVVKDQEGRPQTDIHLKAEYDAIVADKDKVTVSLSTQFSQTGTSSPDYGNLLLLKLMNAMPSIKADGDKAKTTAINGVHEVLLEMNPKDAYEGMLCSKIIALHDNAMHMMQKASNPGANIRFTESCYNQATKLMRMYNETLMTLEKYRRRGEQKIVVQQVTVTEGGQAVVNGSMSAGGRESLNKKTVGEAHERI